MANKIRLKRTSRKQKKKKLSADVDPLSSLPKMFEEALTLHQNGRFQQAEALYRQMITIEPKHSDALHYLGIIHLQMGRLTQAVDLIRRALSYRPDYADAHINLGIVLKAQGKTDESTASLLRALTLAPNNFVAHNNLGNIFRDQGKMAEAAASYRQAISLRPDYAEAHYNLGTILHNQGEPDQAAACYRQALIAKPDYTEAYNNLGNIFKQQGKLDEAVACYKQALTTSPDDAVAHNNLGNTFKAQGKLEEAIISLRQALSFAPNFAEAYRNLGVTYRELGRMDDAISCLKKAVSLKPDYAAAYRNLSLLVKYTQDDSVVLAMENLYNNKEKIPEADRIDLGFALGRIFEKTGNYEKSFNFILEANTLKRGAYNYSSQTDQALFERVKTTFSLEFFKVRQSFGDQNTTPIFIVGMPRSGTTLTEQILATHPQVFGAGELEILPNLVDRVCAERSAAWPQECVPKLDQNTLTQMGTEYLETLRKFSSDACYITDKLPYNFLHVGLIKIILPRAKVIHCQRNPMDTCFSIFKTEFAGLHEYAYDMAELGRYYKLYLDLMSHWEKVLPGFMYTLQYEEIVSDQKSQTKKLLDFCALPWDDACLNFHKTARRVTTASLSQVRQPLYQNSVGRWKCYERQLEPLRKAIYEIN